ncbi:MAG: mevalonate 5-phosphate dehydratase large subunit [Euryarchaeota archaeon]|jgi:predicted aconitase|nr:mevalonate 5-phosphate dehydratase large subunit [Euryarchaeota archaeon]MDN5340123.1 mevalonate 5-phosphate dehydratase large subunit [Euryarchaeota archaeon]
MYLDASDEKVLAGEFGETRQKMMEILVALGEVYGAEKLIPITSAQVSGASYKTIGKWGLSWLQSLNARAAVPAVLNPIGMPREGWQEFGIDEEFASRQAEVVEAYRRLGIRVECTCTPYYLRITEYGEHLAWSESSAVAYANSVLGARTNREGGPSALAAAIIGKTPYYGLHIVENRRPQVVVEVEGGTGPHANHWGAIGHVAGKKVGNRIPLFEGIRPNRDQLKALGAAMAATGAVALFHVDKITPETRVFNFPTDDLDRITVTEEEIEALFAETKVEAVAVGCPHCSADELRELAELLRGKRTTKPFYVFAAKGVAAANPDLVGVIERSGARVITDTCMVVSPRMDEFSSIMVDSGKAFAYVPGMCGALARIGTRRECVEVATS